MMLCVSDTVLHRFSNTLRFCWVLLSALLDSLTAWLSGLCQEHIDISTVLRIEHCMLTQQAKQVHTRNTHSGLHSCELEPASCLFCLLLEQGNLPTREAINIYYQEQMMNTSRESGLDYSTQDAEGQASAVSGQEEGANEEGVSPDTDEEGAAGRTAEEKPSAEPMSRTNDEEDPDLKQDPEPESGSGPDQPDEILGAADASGLELETVPEKEVPECTAAKNSQRSRPKLSRMERVQSLLCLSASEEEELSRTHRSVETLLIKT